MEDALARGEIDLWVRDAPSPGSAPKDEPPPSWRPPPSTTLTWIGVRVVDDREVNLVGQQVRITDPSGAVHSGTTDDHGHLRIDGIPAGVCDVVLPEIDGRDWSPSGPRDDGDLRLAVAEHGHTVAEGECFSSLARDEGFRRLDAFLAHPANKQLLAERQNPNVLAPGDRMTVPDRFLRVEPAETTTEHRYVVASPRVLLRIHLTKERGRWRSWKLTVPGSPPSEGDFRDEDATQIATIPIAAGATDGVLELRDGETTRSLSLRLGSLDPWNTEPGWEARLRNLGYLRARPGSPGARRRALTLFQRDNGLVVDGEPGAQTLLALRTKHGS